MNQEFDILRQSENTLLISEETRRVGDGSVCYRLHAERRHGEPVFYITARTQNETAEGEVGCDLFRSVSLFRRIVRGGVTPCTLRDILRDVQVCDKF